MRYAPLLVAIAVVAVSSFGLSFLRGEPAMRIALVTDVVDGDTLTIEGGSRVRLLGIDTRERGEPCYQEAKDFLKELVEMKEIGLEADAEDKDRYGRLLRHVWLNGTHINLEIMKQGLAVALVIEPNVKYREKIAAAEKEARQGGVGCLWE
jgi:micrococcal nuclease